MASLNKILLIGNVGRDPEMRYTAGGTAQTSFSLAVNRGVRGPDGEWKEETDWFNVVAWRELAERLSQSISKGKQIYVEGRLQFRSWDDDQGVKHQRAEVIANQVLLLERRPREGGGDEWGDGGSSVGAGAPRGAAAAPRTGGGSSWSPRGGAAGGAPSGAAGGGAASSGGSFDADDLPFE
jgi:single-strand DNA-binding protein